jgi:antitoxin VapB
MASTFRIGDEGGGIMAETGTAKLFMDGRSQAVRLPKEFRMPGAEVRVRRVGNGGVLLEPIGRDSAAIEAVFVTLDRLRGADFLSDRRPAQPPMPPVDNVSFDE